MFVGDSSGADDDCEGVPRKMAVGVGLEAGEDCGESDNIIQVTDSGSQGIYLSWLRALLALILGLPACIALEAWDRN